MTRFLALIAVGLSILTGSFQGYGNTRAAPPAQDAVDYTQGGYADQTSVPQGGTIAFHIATAYSPFDLKIFNNNDLENPVAVIQNLVSQPQDCTGMSEQGCGWPVTATFTIPADWPSGYYSARFPTSTEPHFIIFVVRSVSPG